MPIEHIPLSKIIPGENDRKSFDYSGENGIASLAESILSTDGLRGAIIVRVHPTIPGMFQIVGGERRTRACKLIHLAYTLMGDTQAALRYSTIPCDVITELDDAQTRFIMASENMIRRDLNPIEEGESFRRMLDHGDYESVESLARKFGRKSSYVQDRLDLLHLSDLSRVSLLDKNTGLSIAFAVEMVRGETKLNPAYQQRAITLKAQMNLSLVDFRKLCDRFRAEQNSAQADFFSMVPLEVVAESVQIERTKTRAEIEAERDSALALLAAQRKETEALRKIVLTLGKKLSAKDKAKLAAAYRQMMKG